LIRVTGKKEHPATRLLENLEHGPSQGTNNHPFLGGGRRGFLQEVSSPKLLTAGLIADGTDFAYSCGASSFLQALKKRLSILAGVISLSPGRISVVDPDHFNLPVNYLFTAPPITMSIHSFHSAEEGGTTSSRPSRAAR
jgi:hypothetical protein